MAIVALAAVSTAPRLVIVLFNEVSLALSFWRMWPQHGVSGLMRRKTVYVVVHWAEIGLNKGAERAQTEPLAFWSHMRVGAVVANLHQEGAHV